MAKSPRYHPRSEASRVRRRRKERTRRALRAASLGLPRGLDTGIDLYVTQDHPVTTKEEVSSSSKVDNEGVKLYKRAVEVALDAYKERCSKITDGTGAANVVEWGPLVGDKDPIEDIDRHQTLIESLRGSLRRVAKEIVDASAGDDIRKWINLSRDDQGDHQEIWDSVLPLLRSRAADLRSEFYRLLDVDSETDKGPQKLRASLLRGLLLATGSQADPDDVEILDEILRGGVGIGIDEEIPVSGRWPRVSQSEYRKDEDLNHGTRGLSLFALDSWKNYLSAGSLDEQVRQYLHHEVEVGNMQVLQGMPTGGVVSKIAAIEKRPGESDSPIRVIDDLRRSGVNAKVKTEETLQLPGLATTAYLIHSYQRHIQEETTVRGPDEELMMIEVDCAAAYRNVPIKESERKYCMNFVPPKEAKPGILICHSRLPFGLSPSGLLWVRVYSGVIIIIKRLIAFEDAEGVQVYIDDLNYLTVRGKVAIKLIEILLLHEVIGVDLSYHKIRVSSTPVVLGFQWDLSVGTVTVAIDRQKRLLDQISPLVGPNTTNKSVSVQLLQSIIGRSAWMAQIICQFRPWLKPLYGRLGIARRKGLRAINLTTEASESLRFILHCLEKPTSISSNTWALLGAGCRLDGNESVGVVVSDASLHSMAALVMLPEASYWFMLSSAQKEVRSLVNKNIDKPEEEKWTSGDISSLELIAALGGASLLPTRSPGLLLCDNIAAVEAINRAAGRAARMNNIVMKTSQMLAFGRGLKAAHITTHDNWLVDRLSRTLDIVEARELMKGSSFQEVDGLYLLHNLLD